MYTVKFYKGDYSKRQRDANADKAVAYVEHHFNSFTSTSNYAVVITGSNASTTSKNWGRWYATEVAEQFGIPVGGDNGIKVGGFGGRGDGSIKYTDMPAVLLEPLFASNPRHADIIRSESGQSALAQILVESIRRFFPDGGLIAFSVGHKYKDSSPEDRGAILAGGGNEADFAEKVLKKAEALLIGADHSAEGRIVRVMRGDKLLFETRVDEDAVVTWSSGRNLLFIPE